MKVTRNPSHLETQYSDNYQEGFKEGAYEEDFSTYQEEIVEDIKQEDAVVVNTNHIEGLVLKAPSKEEQTIILPFSDIQKDGKVNFSDIYVDARSFLAKANSTKFVIVAFILVLSPFLLVNGYLSEDVYREIILIASLAYIGVDAYQSTKNFGRKPIK